jgi:hypothetical protein
MRGYRWYLALIVALLAVSLSSAGGCTTAAVPGEAAPPSTSTTDTAGGISTTSAPVINLFTASPATISSGEQATLSWDVSGATTVTIQPALDSAGSSGVKHGVEQVSPASTTTYTLAATNEVGTTTRSATVTVASADESAATSTGDGTLIGCDPVSGRNEEIDLTWEQFCLSTEYQVQIAKDPNFTIIVLDTGVISTESPTSPGVYYPAGGRATPPAASSALASPSVLEAGQTYYWRVRVRGDAWGGSVRGPWSEVKSFTVESGLPVSTRYYGPQLVYPSNACTGCPVKPVSFSWSPFKDTTKYKFVLAKDVGLTNVLAEAEVSDTSYEYQGMLEYGSSYFWRVMAVEPAPSDWSTTFSFQTEAAPAPPVPPPAPPATPMWAWVVIAIGTALVIVTLVFIFQVRRA